MQKVCLAWADRMILLPSRVFCRTTNVYPFFKMALISRSFQWLFRSKRAENGNAVTLMYGRSKNGVLAHTDAEFVLEGRRERCNVCRR